MTPETKINCPQCRGWGRVSRSNGRVGSHLSTSCARCKGAGKITWGELKDYEQVPGKLYLKGDVERTREAGRVKTEQRKFGTFWKCNNEETLYPTPVLTAIRTWSGKLIGCVFGRKADEPFESARDHLGRSWVDSSRGFPVNGSNCSQCSATAVTSLSLELA
jgi:hypothetical protein